MAADGSNTPLLEVIKDIGSSCAGRAAGEVARSEAPVSAGPRVSAFTAEEWADYDNGRPDRCQPDLAEREARREYRNRDGF